MSVELILQLLPYLGIAISWIFKDRILGALNIELKRNEVKDSTTENLEKNFKFYQDLLDEQTKRSKRRDSILGERLDCLEKKVLDQKRELYEAQKETINLKIQMEDKDSVIEVLTDRLDEIKASLEFYLKQIRFYSNNSNVELPEELKKHPLNK